MASALSIKCEEDQTELSKVIDMKGEEKWVKN